MPEHSDTWGIPLVISGPSGVGKTTIARELCDYDGLFEQAVTSTTREPRPDEVDGRDYHFLSEVEFAARQEAGGFIESVSARGARYGLAREELERIWNEGHVPVLVLDPAGRDAVAELYPQTLSVYLDAPEQTILERLRRRGDDPETIRSRQIDNAIISQAKGRYDVVVSNTRPQLYVAAEVFVAFMELRPPEAAQPSKEKEEPAMTIWPPSREEYDERIPEKLQLLRVGLGGKDDLAIFSYGTTTTGLGYPGFCLADAGADPETMDIHAALEETLHELVDHGATDDDIRQIMDLVPRDELDETALEYDEYEDIDLGWCADGNLYWWSKLDPAGSDVHAILTDEQIQHIEEWFDVLSPENALAKAEAVAHDPSYAKYDGPREASHIADLNLGKWRVHLVMPDGHYGLNDAVTYEREEADKHGHGLPLVEFYDTSQNPVTFPGGQFVSRYYMSTLLGLDDSPWSVFDDIRNIAKGGGSLGLEGSVPAWTVGPEELKVVADYLEEAAASLGVDVGESDDHFSLSDMEKQSKVAAETLDEGSDRDEQLPPTR